MSTLCRKPESPPTAGATPGRCIDESSVWSVGVTRPGGRVGCHFRGERAVVSWPPGAGGRRPAAVTILFTERKHESVANDALASKRRDTPAALPHGQAHSACADKHAAGQPASGDEQGGKLIAVLTSSLPVAAESTEASAEPAWRISGFSTARRRRSVRVILETPAENLRNLCRRDLCPARPVPKPGSGVRRILNPLSAVIRLAVLFFYHRKEIGTLAP